MKSVVFRRTGGPEVLELVELPDPQPGPGEILVRSHASAIGWPDIMMRSGIYPWLPPLPVTPGTEMAGRVEALGAGVSGVAVGDPVYVSSREMGFRAGCYANLMCVPAASVHRLAPHVDLTHAAGIGYYALAWALLFKVPRCETLRRVLVIGAAGGVGVALMQVARQAGVEVIGTVRSAHKAAFASGMGAHHVVDTNTEDLNDAVNRITGGEGVDLIIDPVTGPNFSRHFDILAPWGHIVIYNSSGGPAGADLFDRWRAHSARVPSLHYFSMHVYEQDRAGRRALVASALDLLTRGAVSPAPPMTFALDEVRAAHEALEGGRVLGRAFLLH